MNRFTQKYLVGVGSLIVDGKKGPLTNKRIRRVKFYLGYKRAQGRLLTADPDFLRQMEHPRSARASSPAMVARGMARRRKQHKAARTSARPREGVVTFDGKPVASWMRPHLEWARTHGWQGSVLSGYRTPEESEQLCREKCGAPKCPGKCAGRDSNHSGRIAPAGALDVTDYVRFHELMKRCPHQPSIKNAVPTDINHFSHAGN